MSDVPPPKPWEINRMQNNANIGPLHSTSIPSIQETPQEASRKSTPPPVPTRPTQSALAPTPFQSSYGGYSSYGYGSGYGGLGYGAGGLYGGYGGGYYGSYNRPYGMNGGFTRQAEESTRSAFQSVESIVRAFTSVSAMLESTLGAVYSSFRAVLDVADQFSRVRATFADILSSITIFRFIRFLYRRAKTFLNIGGQCDEAWDNANDNTSVVPRQKKSKSWPMLLFMAVVLGGPYLIWKLLSGTTQQKTPTTWASGLTEHVVAKVEYDFEGETDEELTVKAGDMLNLAPKDQQPFHSRGWVLASLDGKNTGMIPANYVKILGRRKGQIPSPNTTSQPSTTQSAVNPAQVSSTPQQNTE